MSIIQGTSKAAGGAVYEIDQSIRFNDDDSAYLSRTPGSAGDKRTWTFSVWTKRGNLGADRRIFTAASNGTEFFFDANDKLNFYHYSGGFVWQYISTAVFRDPSAWYHFLLRVDTTDATAGNRIRVYANGQQINDWGTSTSPSLNAEGFVNGTSAHYIGRYSGSDNNHWDGYLAEINHVDGSSLAPTDFGETNDDGVWIPKAYTGSYGTNGFYITGATASDLGEDFSGNNNDFTSTGLATTDQMLDTPTNNFWTLNPTDPYSSNISLSEGNLRAVMGATATGSVFAPMLPETGKWAWKITATLNRGPSSEYPVLGIVPANNADLSGPMRAGGTGEGYGADGRFFSASNGTNSAYGATWADGDIIEVGWDADNGTLSFWHNGSAQGVAVTGLTGRWKPAQDHYTTAGGDTLSDFGQSGYTPTDASYKTLCTANLATPSITDGSAHFNPVLFTGNSGTAFSVTGVGFQPDFVWGKSRSSVDNHRLIDVVRGSTKHLLSNAASAESTQAQGITSFDSDGFTVGTHPGLNNGTNTYVAWCWKANGAGSSNTDGSINTTATSVNTTAGFSISTYTGNGTSGATFGHGLGVAPKMVIVKERSPAGNNWKVGHDAMGWGKYLALDTSAAPVTSSTHWNNTAPSSTVVTLGNDTGINENTATYVAYCFAEIPGYSSIGSYEGNGSTDGTFVYTGFRPSFLLVKNIDATDSWQIRDSKRDPFNVSKEILYPNTTGAEATSGGGQFGDLLSNGFKWRGADPGNNSAATFIYMAFAENPFGGDGVAPATAR